MNVTPQLPPVRLIGFCGRQDMLNPGAVAKALAEQLGELAATEKSRLLAVSPLTGPADLLFSREILRLHVPLVVFLPMTAEALRASLSPPDQVDFDYVLSHAEQAEVLDTLFASGGPIPLGSKLVDETDLLLLVTRSAPPAGVEEITEIIAYATSRNRSLIVIEEAEEKVAVRSISPSPAEVLPKAGMASVAAQLGGLPPALELPDELTRYFTACDLEASRKAPQVRRYLLSIVLANATASMAGSIDSSFPQTPLTGTLLTLIKFGCILLGLVIFGVMRYRQSQSHWLGLRLKAEVCRSALATWRSPRAIELLSVKDLPELHDLIQAIRYFRAVHRPSTQPTLQEFKAEYGVRRLLDQYLYFRNQADKATQVSARYNPLYWFCSGTSLLTAAGAVVYQSVLGFPLNPGTWVHFFFEFIPAIGPALASWMLAFQAIQSVGRRMARFRELEGWMAQALLDLTRCTTWEATYQVVERAEKLLLDEVAQWYSFVKFAR